MIFFTSKKYNLFTSIFSKVIPLPTISSTNSTNVTFTILPNTIALLRAIYWKLFKIIFNMFYFKKLTPIEIRRPIVNIFNFFCFQKLKPAEAREPMFNFLKAYLIFFTSKKDSLFLYDYFFITCTTSSTTTLPLILPMLCLPHALIPPPFFGKSIDNYFK